MARPEDNIYRGDRPINVTITAETARLTLGSWARIYNPKTGEKGPWHLVTPDSALNLPAGWSIETTFSDPHAFVGFGDEPQKGAQ